MVGTLPPGIDAEELLAPLRQDRRSGATALSRRLLASLEPWVRQALRRPDWRATLRRTSRAVRSAQPAMGAFQRWADRLDRAGRGRSRSEAGRRLRERLHRERVELSRETLRALRTAQDRFPRGTRVLTISRSELVERTLREAHRRGRLREAIVLESLPGGEGRALGRALTQEHVPVRVVKDRTGPAYARKVDLILIGADAVYADGSVVHKVGTRRVALAAREAGVPVYVVSGRSKWVERRHVPRSLPAYFDVTPRDAVRAFWTDRGVRWARRTGRNRPRQATD